MWGDSSGLPEPIWPQTPPKTLLGYSLPCQPKDMAARLLHGCDRMGQRPFHSTPMVQLWELVLSSYSALQAQNHSSPRCVASHDTKARATSWSCSPLHGRRSLPFTTFLLSPQNKDLGHKPWTAEHRPICSLEILPPFGSPQLGP